MTIQSDFTSELKVDQSVSHNGVCLTVVSICEPLYTVTAIKETLEKTNLRQLKENDTINLERDVESENLYQIVTHHKKTVEQNETDHASKRKILLCNP